jgi:hypothetical protein
MVASGRPPSSDSSDCLAVPQARQNLPESPDKNVGSEPPQILAPTADLGPFLNSVSTTSSAFLDSRATRERSAP